MHAVAIKVPRKEVRKLTIEITDPVALAAAYPQVMETKTIVTTFPNRELLRPIVKAMHSIGVQVPGVNAYYAADQQEPTITENGLQNIHD